MKMKNGAIWDCVNQLKRCPKCRIWKPWAEFRPNKLWYGKCKYCRSTAINRPLPKTDDKSVKELSEKQKTKLELMVLKGDKCEKCGFHGHPQVFDFHHREPEDKLFSMSGISQITSKVLAELAKCDLLCSNCHRLEHRTYENPLR